MASPQIKNELHTELYYFFGMGAQRKKLNMTRYRKRYANNKNFKEFCQRRISQTHEVANYIMDSNRNIIFINMDRDGNFIYL